MMDPDIKRELSLAVHSGITEDYTEIGGDFTTYVDPDTILEEVIATIEKHFIPKPRVQENEIKLEWRCSDLEGSSATADGRRITARFDLISPTIEIGLLQYIIDRGVFITRFKKEVETTFTPL